MKRFKNKKNIIWDFDGVIIDSHKIRIEGFKKVLENFPKHEIDLLLDFHSRNGGLSRYVKFEYFFNEIRKERVSKAHFKNYADRFSGIMREQLVQKDFLIIDTMDFIKSNQQNFRMHIVSGSDGDELRYLCDQLEITDYFLSIEGSPTPKTDLVEQLMLKYNYLSEETLLIGDAINDYHAAENSGIDFWGYNNPDLIGTGKGYFTSFKTKNG